MFQLGLSVTIIVNEQPDQKKHPTIFNWVQFSICVNTSKSSKKGLERDFGMKITKKDLFELSENFEFHGHSWCSERFV